MSGRPSASGQAADGLTLTGLSGDNPLAFLAALGTLRVLSDRWTDRDVRMSWHLEGAWRPALHADGVLGRAEVVRTLDECLRGRDRAPEFTLAEEGEPRELILSPGEFAGVAARAARRATRDDRTWADFCAAYGTDAFSEEPSIRDTALRFTSGQQSFLGSIRELAAAPPESPPESPPRKKASDPVVGTTVAHIDHALFETWSYSDSRPSLRWDPIDDRRYALRAFDPTNPSASPILTVRGANRLAIEALPWLPTFPRNGGAVTRGFHQRDREMVFSWPLWGPPLTAATVRSILGLEDLHADTPPRASLQARGIVEVVRARRIGGYYRNFSPGVACWGTLSPAPTTASLRHTDQDDPPRNRGGRRARER